jgi:O-Antigen ligase
MAAPSTSTRRTRPGAALVLALVAASLYAAFAHGAVGLPDEARLQVGLAIVAVCAAGSWLLGAGGVRLAAPVGAWWGVGLLAAFAAWCGLSLLWSATPDRTWIELNRAIAYTLVVVLAVAAAASAPRAIERVAVGYLLVAAAVALYALGGKVAPGVNVPGVFDLNTTGDVARLRAPLQYWNALALVCVLAVPVAMRLATEVGRSMRVRLPALAALYLFALVVGMTYSRGGVLALLVAVTVMTLLGPARLRGLLVLAMAAVAAAPPLAVAFSREALKGNAVPLGARIHDGRLLLGVVLICLGVLLAAGWLAFRLEPRALARWSPRRSELVWWVLGSVAALAVAQGVFALAASPRGFTGSISHGFHSFTQVREDKQYDPVRLVSTNSGNRWVWWEEAVGAASDKPVGGWGAGSFPLTHKLYRKNTLPVAQPHSVPLQFLAETGIVGFSLAMGGLLLLLGAALVGVRRMEAGRERALAVALLAAAAGWLAHGLYDWDWDLPGVTVPALLFLGVLVGVPAGRPVPQATVVLRDPAERLGVGFGRVAALAGATLLLAGVVASSVLPALSDAKTSDAAARAGAADGNPAIQQEAAAEAELAARLNPLAVRPLFVAASIAEGRGRLLDARRYLLQAARRQPQNAGVWFQLAGVALQLADRQGFASASLRALDLDPENPGARALALRGQELLAPPEQSATAVGTPLAPPPVAAPPG